MSSPFDFSAEAAATDQELALVMAALRGKSFDEIRLLLPPTTDQQKLRELVAIVNGTAGGNNQVASFRSTLGKLGAEATRLLKAFV